MRRIPKKIRGLVASLANNTAIPYLVELHANATTWEISQFCLAFGNVPGSITVTNGNFKRSDGSYFGGNASLGNRLGEGHYSSDHDGQSWQAFTVRVINNGGTLQHWIRDASNAGSAGEAVAGAIYNRSASLTNTPTGSDSSTPFAAGLKVSSAAPSQLIFDTPSQKIGASMFMTPIVANTTGTALTAIAAHQSVTVNGVTRTRLTIQLLDAAAGGGFDLNTTNIGAGEYIQVVFFGLLST